MKKYKKIIKRALLTLVCIYSAIYIFYFIESSIKPYLIYGVGANSNQLLYAYTQTNKLLKSPHTKLQQYADDQNRQKQFFEKVAQKDPTTIKRAADDILISYLPHAQGFTANQLLELIQTAEDQKIITPLYYYLFYTTPYLNSTNSPVKNPLYQLDHAWNALEDAAFKGSQNAQLLLSHYYEYGELFGYKTEIDPIEALAWKVNARFQNNEDIIFNLQSINKTQFISSEIARLNILDTVKATNRINEILQKYPIKYFTENNGAQLSESTTVNQKKLIEQSYNGDRTAIRDYARKLYQGYLGFCDYENSYQWYQSIFDLNDPKLLLELSTFYTTKGNEKHGLNPYYDQKKSINYLTKSGMLGNLEAIDALYKLYDRGHYTVSATDRDIPDLETTIDKPIGNFWFIIKYMDKNGVINISGTEYSVDFLLQNYSEEDKARTMKLIDKYRDLHSIPKL